MDEASKIKIAFDKGNNSQKNIRAISGNEYIGSLVPSSHPDLTSIGADQYTKSYKGFKVYEWVKEIYGAEHKILLCKHTEVHQQRGRNGKNENRKRLIPRLRDAIVSIR